MVHEPRRPIFGNLNPHREDFPRYEFLKMCMERPAKSVRGLRTAPPFAWFSVLIVAAFVGADSGRFGSDSSVMLMFCDDGTDRFTLLFGKSTAM